MCFQLMELWVLYVKNVNSYPVSGCADPGSYRPGADEEGASQQEPGPDREPAERRVIHDGLLKPSVL